jgi:glutamate N-acetyltransferase/amino-acid N-acetyltransferase
LTLELIPDGTVTSPKGYAAGAVYAGIKTYGEDKLDIGILAAEGLCTAAGVFTRSTVPGAPVIVSKKHLSDGRARAIVVNAGCANVCTGEQGIADAIEMATLAAGKLGCDPHHVVVASTGVIGRLLPMDKIRAGISQVELLPDGGEALSRAIMTTDTRPKRIAASFEAGGVRYTVGGIAKGSGMIHPDMATMFGFLTTDAPVEGAFLGHLLRTAVHTTFNMVSVDNDTSTSDTVTLFANGAAGGPPITARHPASAALQEAVTAVSRHLAREIARDGEGATKLIEVRVTGASNETEARAAARTISASPLVKSAVYGNDPNWGRIMMAVGRSGAHVDTEKARVAIGEAVMYENGRPQKVKDKAVEAALKVPEVFIHADLGVGSSSAIAWGCDLTEQYVKINADYTT